MIYVSEVISRFAGGQFVVDQLPNPVPGQSYLLQHLLVAGRTMRIEYLKKIGLE